MAYSCTVLGGSGYAGGELVRLLLRHPALTLEAVFASKSAGIAVADLLPHLAGASALQLRPLDQAPVEADVCFSCLPHGVLPQVIDSVEADLVVDLSDDYRFDPGWAYGLPELNRVSLRGAARVANPGCYPTASLLCLLPFVRAGIVEGPVVVDAMSGVSGAGRAAEDRLLFSNVDASVAGYGTTTHRHVPEIEQGLALFGGKDLVVSFTPHLVPMPRGLLVTARATLLENLDDAGAAALLRDAYRDEPFVTVVEGWPATKPVSGTNHAHVGARVDVRAGMLVCSAAIDNLGKGAASQAVQNANLALGLDEVTGLEALGVWP